MKYLLSLLLPLALFLILAATRHHFQNLNIQILQSLHSYTSPTLTEFSIALAILGDNTGMTILSIIAVSGLVYLRRTRDALMLAAIMIVGSSMNAWLKTVFQDPRPDLFPSFYPAGGYSFPSGHAQAAMGLFGTLARLFPRWYVVVLSILMIVAIGWCRLDLGVHWPTDVLGGLLLGASVSNLGFVISRWGDSTRSFR